MFNKLTKLNKKVDLIKNYREKKETSSNNLLNKSKYLNDNEYNIIHNYIQQKGGECNLFHKLCGKHCATISTIVQFILDVVGLIPEIGIPVDIAATIFSLVRCDWSGAVLSGISAIPIIGEVGPFIKWIPRIIKHFKD